MKAWLLAAALLASPLQAAEAPSAAAIVAAFDRMAALPLWPGFAPLSIPIAIYDGRETWLVRHPKPPEGFVQRGDFLWTFAGQHPAMRANTSTDLGGVSTATLLLEARQPGVAQRWASVLIHEAFHVFQRQHHPTWQANEGDLFVYPVDDAEQLAGRRLESEALRRALAAPQRPGGACWTARALEQRRIRFGRLPAGGVAYERGTELNEGLAAFVEDLAFGAASGSEIRPELPAEGYGPGEVRLAAYGTGPALARLLDRFDPLWKDKLESGSAASLDELLAVALPLAESAGCAFTREEVAAVRAKAAEDTARFVAARKEHRTAFFAQPGLRLVVEAGDQPLWPQGFDPWNVEPLGGPEVLHRRWIKLGNDRGTLEVLDREALTEGAGEHPLFNGVRKLTLTGLPAEPKVSREGETVNIDGGGLTAALRGAIVEHSPGMVRITWPQAPAPAAGAAPPTAPGPRSSTD